MDIRVLVNALQAIGVGTGARAARYSQIRDRIDRSNRENNARSDVSLPGLLQKSEVATDGAIVSFQKSRLIVKFLSSNLVSISWDSGKTQEPYTIARHAWEPANIHYEYNDQLTLSSGKLKLIVKNDGSIQFFSQHGAMLRTDLPPQRNGESWQAITQFRTDEHIYGLGERATSLNLAGQSLYSWNTDPGGSYSTGKDPIYICTPVYMAIGSTGSYLIYYENPYPSQFDFQSLATVNFSGGQLRYYFSCGSPREALEQYANLTGRPPLSPRWVFGYHQSRWGYSSEAEIRDVVAGFSSNELPISAIHLDIDYMDQYRVFTVDKARFPNLRQLSADLNAEGINLVTIIDPGVKKDRSFPIYQDGIQNDVFCKTLDNKVLHGVVWPGWAAYPDFTNPKTRIWWGKLYEDLLDEGIAGFWHDMNEPVSFSAWGDNTLPINTRHDLDGHPGNHKEAHNLYGLLMNKAGYEGLQLLRPEKRPWLISRSGWAGLQRYAWNWTGDVASTWEALKQTVITIIGLSLSGHYLSGSDIGGFSGNPSAELYLRWFQLATFHPFYRTHSAVGTDRREPWLYGEPYTTIIRKYLKLRYELVPYFYTLAWEASTNGAPLIRPIFWDHPEWSEAWEIEDQFLLGDAILIAPVLQSNITERAVTLPKGEWYLFWDDTCHIGPSTVMVSVSLDQVPIFIRAGSILPRQVSDVLELHIYLANGRSAEGQIYSDAGDGYGEYRTDYFKCTTMDSQLHITRHITGDHTFPSPDLLVALHGRSANRALIDGEEVRFKYVSGPNL